MGDLATFTQGRDPDRRSHVIQPADQELLCGVSTTQVLLHGGSTDQVSLHGGSTDQVSLRGGSTC